MNNRTVVNVASAIAAVPAVMLTRKTVSRFGWRGSFTWKGNMTVMKAHPVVSTVYLVAMGVATVARARDAYQAAKTANTEMADLFEIPRLDDVIAPYLRSAPATMQIEDLLPGVDDATVFRAFEHIDTTCPEDCPICKPLREAAEAVLDPTKAP